jgi:uncharacterized damage-inducible protein DinB
MKSYIHYTFDSNQTILDVITNHTVTDEKILKIMSHIILSAQNVLANIDGKPMDADTFKITPTNELRLANEQNKATMLRLIDEREHHEIIPYIHSSGHDFTNCLSDIIHHLFFHASHHRGQISMLLSERVKLPLEINYIAYAAKLRTNQKHLN